MACSEISFPKGESWDLGPGPPAAGLCTRQPGGPLRPRSHPLSLAQAAGNAVKRASDNLVKAAQKAAAFQDHENETVVVKEKMVGGIAQVRQRPRPWPLCRGEGGGRPSLAGPDGKSHLLDHGSEVVGA